MGSFHLRGYGRRKRVFFSAAAKFVLVIGNEANGVSEEMRKVCEYTVSIPMRECCESLNAGISAGILMYHLKYANKIN
ncbi:MAG: TrmH family RNA methyltransferase [Candidatus Borkfalkia sp.]